MTSFLYYFSSSGIITLHSDSYESNWSFIEGTLNVPMWGLAKGTFVFIQEKEDTNDFVLRVKHISGNDLLRYENTLMPENIKMWYEKGVKVEGKGKLKLVIKNVEWEVK